MSDKLQNLIRYILVLFIALFGSLTIIASGGGDSGGGDDDDDSNNDVTTSAIITGTVGGTTVVAIDDTDNEIASDVAEGTPKTFSLTVPTGGTYRFYLIENEGTENERVYPLYQGEVNVFNISSEVTIDLGFVDISSGVAVPENNPLEVSGVTSGDSNTSTPSSLADTAFSTSDLQGSWYFHQLYIGYDGESSEWLYGIDTIDENGTGTEINTDINGQIGEGDSSGVAIGPSGMISVADIPSFNGIMSVDKDLMVFTFDDDEGYEMGILQKMDESSTYDQSDLEGTWYVHEITSAGNWRSVIEDIDSDGYVTPSSVILNGVSQTIPSGSAPVPITIDSSGIVSQSGTPTNFNGYMSPDKNLIIATQTIPAGPYYEIMIFQRGGSTYTTSDLQGTWNGHNLIVGDTSDDPVGWEYQSTTIDEEGYIIYHSVTNNNVGPDITTSTLGLVTLASDGKITTDYLEDFDGYMSINKKLMVGTHDDDIGGHLFIGLK